MMRAITGSSAAGRGRAEPGSGMASPQASFHWAGGTADQRMVQATRSPPSSRCQGILRSAPGQHHRDARRPSQGIRAHPGPPWRRVLLCGTVGAPRVRCPASGVPRCPSCGPGRAADPTRPGRVSNGAGPGSPTARMASEPRAWSMCASTRCPVCAASPRTACVSAWRHPAWCTSTGQNSATPRTTVPATPPGTLAAHRAHARFRDSVLSTP